MVGSVKEGPNHYEILGLRPSATADEIASAFASRMQSHVTNPGEKVDDYALKLRAAYKTLGDPFWRRIYDAQLGLSPMPPEAAPSRPPHFASEEKPAPFMAAASRQPAGQTEQVTSPDFILLSDTEKTESPVEDTPEPVIAEFDQPTTDEPSVTKARRRWTEWGAAHAAIGAAILGVGLLFVLIGLWGNFYRSPNTSRPRASANVEQPASQSNILTQSATQRPALISQESPSSLIENTVVGAKPEENDAVGIDSSALSGPTQAATGDDIANTQIAKEPESSTVASSAQPQVAETSAATASPPDSASGTPATNAQPTPPPVAQVVRPAPTVRPAPVINRASAPLWMSGGLVKGDNPGGRYRGTVTVRFVVQPNGRVSGCRAAVSSGSSALDSRTCRLVEQRLRFRPALDWQGRAIAYETRATYTWGVKHRSLLDKLLKPGRR